MANYEGGGGGTSLSWWDEEERRRKQELGIAGAPIAPTTTRVERPQEYVPVAQRPSEELRARANEESNRIIYSKSETKPLSSLTDFLALERSSGTDTLKKRISDVTTLWKAYVPTLDPTNSVWALVQSSYGIDEIEEMLRQAKDATYSTRESVSAEQLRFANAAKDLAAKKMNPNDVYARMAILAQRGRETPGHSLFERVGHQVAGFLGLARNDDGTINWGWSGVSGSVAKFWEHPNEVAGAVPLAAAIVATGGAAAPTMLGALEGGAATGAAITGTGAVNTLTATMGGTVGKAVLGAATLKATSDVVGQASETWGPDASAFRASERAFTKSQDAAQSYVVRVTDDVLGKMRQLDSDTAQGVMRSLQEGVKDEAGNQVVPGYGTNLPITGAFNADWDEAMRQAITDEIGANIEQQRKWIEQGYAESYYTVDGNMDTEQWTRAKRLALEDQMKWAELNDTDPLKAAQFKMAGIPVTGAGLQALVNRLKSEGVAQAPLKAFIAVVGTFGGGYNAAWATIEFAAKRDNDPVYQDLRSQLNEYVKTRTDLYKEGEAALLENRYAFMDDELLNGKLKDDPKAQEIAKQMKQRTAQIISAGFTPSTIGIIGHVLNMPYDKVEQFKADNEDIDLALNLARDVAIAAYSGPKIRELKRGQPIAATVEAFKGSDAAYLRVQEMANHIKSGQEGLAQDVVRGTDGSFLVRTLSDAYNGKNTNGGFFRNLAHEVARDAEKGDVQTVASKLEKGGVLANQAEATAQNIVNGFDATKSLGDNIRTMGGKLAREQRTTKALLDFDRTAMDHAASAYAEAQQSVFPYFRATQLAGGGLNSMMHRSWLKMVDGMENGNLKRFLGQVGKRFERAPLDSQEYLAQESPARIFEAAYSASDGNVTFANKMRSRWTMARSEVAFDRVTEAIRDEANRTHVLNKSDELRQTKISINPQTGQQIRETLADTGQMQYKAMFGEARDTMWAKKKIVPEMPGYEKVFTKVMGNPWRKLGRGLKKVNDPMRRFTVGFPLLFTKHAITDSTRTFIESGPAGFFDAFRGGKTFEANLAELSPDIANSVRANLNKSKMSEQHYNIGSEGIAFDWQTSQIYVPDKNGILQPKNMAEGVEALRRIGMGKAYQKYAEGGMQGLTDWLITSEGKRFLYKTSNVDATKTYLKEMGLEAKGAKLYDAAVADYIDRFGTGYYEALDLAAPNIAAGLKDMALNKTPLNQKNIESLVKQVNAQGVMENPYLSVPLEPNNPTLGRFLKDPAFRTAQFMKPNKWNRQVLYKQSFNRFYDEMKKQGFNADNAARVATDLAELETTRVHFDLANGLYFEAQNRWYAWFGTKHRLYNSYLLKMATERPSVAGAATTLLNYLEDKNNEDPTASEFDKFTISIPIDWMPGRKKGDKWRFNPATIVWLSEYPLESTVATSMKIAGATAVNVAANKTVLSQDYGDFGFQSGRWDGIVLTAGTLVAAKAAEAASSDDSWLQSFFDNKFLPTRVKNRLSKGMSLVQFEAAGRGETVTPKEAFWKAMASSVIYEGLQLGKPLSGKFMSGSEGEMAALMKEYDKVAPEDKAEWLDKNPQASAAFGIYTTNPVKKMIIDEGWKIVAQAGQKKQQAFEQALSDGTIFNPKVVDAINREFDTQIERLTNQEWLDDKTGQPAPEFNPVFGEAWKNSGYEDWTRTEGIKFLWSLSDERANAINFSGYVPDDKQQADQAAAYTNDYKKRVSDLGWDSLATDSPALFWLKNDMVTEPMRSFTKNAADGDVPWASKKEENVASQLARGEAGATKATAYLNEIHLRGMMEAYGSGTVSNSTSGVDMSTPLFSKMTTEEKAEIGWNSDKSAEYVWRRWAMMKAAQQKWMRENGVGTSSTKAKKIAAALDEWSKKQGEENEYFRKEYEFAQKPLHERLKELGVGTTGKETDDGWQEFFALVTSYHGDLKQVMNPSTKKPGVSPGAQAASETTKYYLEQLYDLKEREPKWWQEFHQMYTPSKFGFYWRLGDSRDQELWGEEEQLPYDEAYEVL